MNNSVPDWNFGSDTCVTNQQKHMGCVQYCNFSSINNTIMFLLSKLTLLKLNFNYIHVVNFYRLDHELVELLWQNGQVVLHSQTNRKPLVNSTTSTRQVQKNHLQTTLRTSCEPFGNSSNLIQDDETVSWIQYPLEDHPLEQELCSNLLSELPHSEVESYNKHIRQFEEGKFTKLDTSSSAPHVAVSCSQPPNMKPSFVQEFPGIPIPAPRFHVPDSSQRNNNDSGGSRKVLNFSHFQAPPNVNAHFRDKIAGNNLSKGEIRECSVMTVGSSYCGSNHIPQDPVVSRASSNGVWTNTTNLSAEPEAVRDDDVQRTVPQNEKGKSEMLEPTVTSSSGGSGSSLGKTCSLSTRNQGQKRKGMDVEESVEQSEVKPHSLCLPFHD